MKQKALSLNLRRVYEKRLYPREELLADKRITGEHFKHLNFRRKLNIMSSLVSTFDSGTILPTTKNDLLKKANPHCLPIFYLLLAVLAKGFSLFSSQFAGNDFHRCSVLSSRAKTG